MTPKDKDERNYQLLMRGLIAGIIVASVILLVVLIANISPPKINTSPVPSSIGTDTAGGFCQTHTCIQNFPNGKGYIIECRDGTYSHSGGRRGACSYHGGELKP